MTDNPETDNPETDNEAKLAKLAKLEKLRSAIEEMSSGEPTGAVFDHVAEEHKASVRARALRLLDERARSRHELKERLIRAEYDPTVVDMVLDDLERVNLIDDATFAKEWVRQRQARRGKSVNALRQELVQKGVDASQREEALKTIDPEDERGVAKEVAAKKARSIKAVPADRAERDKHLRRIVGALARRGFPQSMSMAIAIEALDERIAELS